MNQKQKSVEKDYSTLSKEDLVKIVEKLESRKKYGLIWDEEKVKEQFEKDAQNALPVLKEIKGKEIVDKDQSKPINILIEGDNYHALSVLNFTHQGKIDVIYIDPPYNTGSTDWKYNNDYVDSNDTYRHSKWLSMMSKRLRLARRLLTEDGVLICAIDENELSRLGMLLEEVFEGYEIHCVTIVHNPRGIQGTNFSYTNEYAYFCFPAGKKVIGPRKIKQEDIDWRNLRDNGGESLRTDARNCFYPIIVKDGKVVGFGDVVPNETHPKKQTIKKDDEYFIYPIDPKGIERKWRYARQSVDEIKNLLRAKPSKGGYEIELGKDFGTVRTVWQDSRYDSNEYGTKLVHTLVPDAHFDFPKSVHNTYDCIAPIMYNKKDATILDFFAGSGTTGHALMLMNKEDDGQRKFILCTNNENGIAEDVCYPRIKAVIKGNKEYPDLTGIASSLKYFKTKFIKNTSNPDDAKRKITEECTEMLCLRENVFDEVKSNDEYRIFQHGNKILAAYYALERSGLKDLKKDLDKFDGDKVLYCFTLDPLGLDKKDFKGWDNVTLEPIPQKILDVYKQIYEY
ncbi:MAG: site-specific DNA-methyltransferase [Patescibacteria group bacterium]|nr:site-specific DNA-methyltransferase [Patescibacteria group bacterium]